MTIQTTGITRILRPALAVFLMCALANTTALADRNRGNVRSSSRSSVNRNTNVNHNMNVNRNVSRNIDVDRDIDVDIDVDHHGGCCYHSGWGTAAAVATTAVVTAAVVGSRVNTLPPSCSVVLVNGFTYQQCASGTSPSSRGARRPTLS